MSGRGKRSRDDEDVWNVPGGYMGMKKSKLEEQYSEQAAAAAVNNNGGLFRGVAIFVNGWTDPGVDELKRLMMQYGGVFHHYYNRSKTTHIVATNLPDTKVRQLKGNEVIVKPGWITDCVQQQKLLDYKPYLLYSGQSKSQPRIDFDSTKVNKKESPAKDATDPQFLGEFFSNSRLHHISTMAANAKDYVAELRVSSNGTFPARANLKNIISDEADIAEDRVIMHIDMDCFFVSVGLRNRPDLAGQPVAVTHARGNRPSLGEAADREEADRRRQEMRQYRDRAGITTSAEEEVNNSIDGTSSMSEVASCSYQARARGVKNGMFLGEALRLCPDLKMVPYDFPGYEAVSRELYDTVASYTLDIQAVSCDEMFVDLTGLLRDVRPAGGVMTFVKSLRREIREKTGCSCSVGLGESILLARMATKKAKPDGEFYLTAEMAEEFLTETSVDQLPGVGRSTARKLRELGVETCGQLRNFGLAQMKEQLGAKLGQQLWGFCRGKDSRGVELAHVRKTVSAEVNYGIRFSGWDEADRFLAQLSQEVATRLDKLGLVAGSVTMKLMARAGGAAVETAKYLGHGVCDSLSRSCQLKVVTRDGRVIAREAGSLLRSCRVPPPDMRGLGITMGRLEAGGKDKVSAKNSILRFTRKEDRPRQTLDVPHSQPTSTSTTKGRLLLADIDKEFLAALPPELRNEVMAEHGGVMYTQDTDRYNLERKTAELEQTRFEPIPATSDSITHQNIDFDNGSDDVANLSFSMIDPNVLSELPECVQVEIRQNYKSKSKPLQKQAVASAFDAIMIKKNTTSPVKPRSTRRGSPKTEVDQTLISQHMQDNDNLFTSNAATPKKKSANQDCLHIPLVDEDPEVEVDFPPLPVPSFCGHTELTEIRPMLKEWFSSTTSPDDDDVQLLASFLHASVTIWRIDLVSVIVKTIYRAIVRLGLGASWRRALNVVVDKVQEAMVAVYGHPLHVEMEF